MGSTRRPRPARLALLLALALPAFAEGPVRPGGIAETDENLAEALAHAAQGLSLSTSPKTDAEARAAFEEAVRLDPLSRAPYRLLLRRLAGPGHDRERAALRAREARAFGTRADWRRALSAAVLAEDAPLVREAVAALVSGVRPDNATRDSAADLGAAALALCRVGEGDDAVHPLRRYFALAGRPALVPAHEALSTFVESFRGLVRAPAASGAERIRRLEALLRLFRDAPLACTPQQRAEALSAAGGALAPSDDPAARALFRRMALESLRLAPVNAPCALFVALAAADDGKADGDDGDAPEPSLEETFAKIDAFAARPEAAGLGYSFALARSLAARFRRDGPVPAAATNALAEAEAAWAAEHPGEPLPSEHAAFRLELFLDLGLGAAALEGSLRGLPEDLRGLDPSFANNLAYTLACEGGDLDLALRLADRSLAHDPESPEALDTLGWIFHLRGDDEEALEMLLRSMKRLDSPRRGDAEVFDHVGDVLDALGRGTEALAAWTQACRLDPTDERREKLRSRGLDPDALAPSKKEEGKGSKAN